MASVPNPLLTPEEYLEIEIRTEYRNEYIDGQVFAMAGVSEAHSFISGNLYFGLRSQLAGSASAVHANEFRARTGDASMYAYPDVLVVCGPSRLEKYKGTDTLINPVVIFEVLSPSTEVYDRRDKFQKYRSIETLKEYVLVAQDRVLVERFLKQPSGEWLYLAFSHLEDSLPLASVPATLKLADIYQGVFPPEGGDSQ